MRYTTLGTFSILLSCCCLILCGTNSSNADVIFWQNVAAGDFDDPGNWGGTVPDADDFAVFSPPFTADTVVITFNGDAESLALQVGPVDLTLNLQTFTYAVNLLELNPDAIVTVNNGVLSANSATITSNSVLNIATDATLETGVATINGGSEVNVEGTWDGGTGIANTITVGSSSAGTLNIGHDGNASTGTGGSVTTSNLIVGGANGGDGVVNIGEDASLVASTATIGVANGASGAVNVGDDGLFRIEDLTIGGGGTVTQTGTGAVLVADAGIDIDNLDQDVQNLIDAGGVFVANNSLTIINGGLLESTAAFIDSFSANVTATVTIDGEDSLLDLAGGEITVGNTGNGLVIVSGGGAIASGDSTIGAQAGGSGTVTVTGEDGNNNSSEWSITGMLTVGDDGAGTLNVADGGLVSVTGNVDIGTGDGEGTVLVTGEDSLLDVGGDLNVGVADAGQAVDVADVAAILQVTEGGTIDVAGTLLVDETGMLTGDGTLIGTLTVNGIIRPGNPTGTLTITGTLTMEDGSTFLVTYTSEEIDDGVLQSGMIEVDGNADIDAGTLVHLVNVGDGPIQEGDQLIILHADAINIIGGDLEDILVEDAIAGFIEWILTEDVDDGESLVLTAQFQEEELDEAIAGLSSNFQNVADVALQVPDIRAGLFSLPEADLERGLKSLMPLQHTAAQVQGIRTAQVLNNSFVGQMAAHRSGMHAAGGAMPRMFGNMKIDADALAQTIKALDQIGAPQIKLGAVQEQSDWGGFFQGVGVWENVDSSTDRTGQSTKVIGGHAGIHHNFSPNFLLGVSAGYLVTDIDFNDNFGDADIDTIRVGPYFSWSPGGGDLFIDGSATYGYHRIEMNRNVLVPMPGTATADYDAHDLSALLQAGYDFRLGESTVLTPIGGVEYTHLRTDSFEESGSGANLDVDSQNINSLRLRLGAKVAHAVVVGDTTIVPEIYGGWAHEFLDTDLDVRSRFVAGGPDFTTRTAGVGRGALQVGAGFTAMAGTYITLYVRYEGEFQSDRDSHGVVGGLNINF